ncbi:MAG: hypothetical protein HPY82_22355 [Gammaproteobacteria bacterium]|nr:hypothetical protein [Gammaproteobacteria bacterium]
MDHNSDTERRVFTVDEARALALRSVGRAKPAETAALLMPGYREEAFGWIFIVNKDIEFHPTAMEKDSAIVVSKYGRVRTIPDLSADPVEWESYLKKLGAYIEKWKQ